MFPLLIKCGMPICHIPTKNKFQENVFLLFLHEVKHAPVLCCLVILN